MIEDWINADVLSNLDKFSKEFSEAEPFPVLSIDEFLNVDKLNELIEVVRGLDFYVEDHDLYHFFRTVDFKNIRNSVLKSFRDFLMSEEFISFLEKLVGFKLQRGKMDLHSLKLQSCDYLLCHDDDVQNRAIAFILNFEDFFEGDGGELDIYDSENGLPTDIVSSILPKKNKFNFFKVTPGKSYHQISEVLCEDKERLSVSGWFYYD